MKKSIKVMLSTLAIGAVSLFTVFGASCSAGDWIEEKINQLMCTHENGVYQTEYVAATCTEDGMTEGTKCVDCDAWITKGDVLKATGHKEVIIEGKAATCLTDGLTDGKECATCGDVLKEQKTIKATGHKVQFLDAKAPTVLEDGHSSGTACVNCGTVYSGCEVIEKLGLEYLATPVGQYAKTEIKLGEEKIAGNVYRFVIASGGSFELNLTLSTGDIRLTFNYLGQTDDVQMFTIPGFENVILQNTWSEDGYEYYDIYFPESFSVRITEDNFAQTGSTDSAKEKLLGKSFVINDETVLESANNSTGRPIATIYRLDFPNK